MVVVIVSKVSCLSPARHCAQGLCCPLVTKAVEIWVPGREVAGSGQLQPLSLHGAAAAPPPAGHTNGLYPANKTTPTQAKGT